MKINILNVTQVRESEVAGEEAKELVVHGANMDEIMEQIKAHYAAQGLEVNVAMGDIKHEALRDELSYCIKKT